MRASRLSSALEDALGGYVHAAATILRGELAGGAEVELELCAQRGRGAGKTPFYSYQPLTGEFIREREPLVNGLAEHEQAMKALVGFDGLDRYLAGSPTTPRGGRAMDVGVSRRGPARVRGEASDGDARAGVDARAKLALEELLEEVFAGQTDFEVRPDRLAAALARLERAEPAGGSDTATLLATLHGLTIGSEEIKLAKGLSIAMPDSLGWAPQAAIVGADGLPDGEDSGHLLAVLTIEESLGESSQDSIERAREMLTDLLRALRLFGDGRVTLGALAWARAGGAGRWSTVPLGLGGRPQGMLVVSPEQEDELRAFCSLVSRRAPHDNELAWALRRFELGCERASPYEGLSDHLLALRALLEPEGPASGLLAGRIAALCATPKDRAKLTERMTKAQALERAIVAGTATERAAPLALARDVADHLRALLRDVICGHLSPGLPRLADELLTAEAPQELHGPRPPRGMPPPRSRRPQSPGPASSPPWSPPKRLAASRCSSRRRGRGSPEGQPRGQGVIQRAEGVNPAGDGRHGPGP